MITSTCMAMTTQRPTERACIRDYIHVNDLAEAHVLAIGALDDHADLTLNLGSGVGYSNLQIVETIKQVTALTSKFAISSDDEVIRPRPSRATRQLERPPPGAQILGNRANRERRLGRASINCLARIEWRCPRSFVDEEARVGLGSNP